MTETEKSIIPADPTTPLKKGEDADIPTNVDEELPSDSKNVVESLEVLTVVGQTAFKNKEYSDAGDALSLALEMAVLKYGEMAPECAPLYYLYGSILTELAVERTNVLQDESGEEPEYEATTPIAGSSREVVETHEIDDKDETSMEKATSVLAGIPAIDAVEAVAEEEPVDDFQLAWEILDLARIIYEGQVANGVDETNHLANVYMSLGQISMETEIWTQGISDFSRAAELKSKFFQSANREVAESYYSLSLMHEFNNDIDLAMTNMEIAKRILEESIAKESVDKEEIAELAEILEDFVVKIDELRVKKADKGKAIEGSIVAEAGKKRDIDAVVNDISSLVRKKLKPVEEGNVEPNESVIEPVSDAQTDVVASLKNEAVDDELQ